MKKLLLFVGILFITLFVFCVAAYAQVVWTCGDTETIEWWANDSVVAHKIEYSTDEGETWTLITNPGGDGWVAGNGDPEGEHDWEIPETPTAQGRMKISWRDKFGTVVYDISDHNFFLLPSEEDFMHYTHWEVQQDSGIGRARCVRKTDDYVYVCGYQDLSGVGDDLVAVVWAIDADTGEVEAEYTYDGDQQDNFYWIAECTSGGIIVCGFTNADATIDQLDAGGEGLIVKLPVPSPPAAWTATWTEVYDDADKVNFVMARIEEVEEDKYVVVGQRKELGYAKKHAFLMVFEDEGSGPGTPSIDEVYPDSEIAGQEDDWPSWFSAVTPVYDENHWEYLCFGSTYKWSGSWPGHVGRPEHWWCGLYVAWIDDTDGEVLDSYMTTDPDGDLDEDYTFEGRALTFEIIDGMAIASGFIIDGEAEVGGQMSRDIFGWEVPALHDGEDFGEFYRYNYPTGIIDAQDSCHDVIQHDAGAANWEAYCGYAMTTATNGVDWWVFQTEDNVRVGGSPLAPSTYGNSWNDEKAYCMVPYNEDDQTSGYFVAGRKNGKFAILFAKMLWDPIPNVTLTYPNGGEEFVAGEVENITWTSTGDGVWYRLTYNVDGGDFNSITGWINDNPGTYPWTVAAENSENCLIRVYVRDEGLQTGSDLSNGVFGISPAEFNFESPGTPVYSSDNATWYVDIGTDDTYGFIGAGNGTPQEANIKSGAGDPPDYAVIVQDANDYEAHGFLLTAQDYAVGSNLIVNGDMEDWDPDGPDPTGDLDGWIRNGANNTSHTIQASSALESYAGSHAAKMVTVSAEGADGVIDYNEYQVPSVIEGARYHFSVFRNFTVPDGAIARVRGTNACDPMGSISATSADGGWTEVTSTFNGVSSDPQTANMYFYLLNGDDSTVLWDNYSLTRVTASDGVLICGQQDGDQPGQWYYVDPLFDPNTQLHVYVFDLTP